MTRTDSKMKEVSGEKCPQVGHSSQEQKLGWGGMGLSDGEPAVSGALSFHSGGFEPVLQGLHFLAGKAVRGSLHEAERPYLIHPHYMFRSCVTGQQARLCEGSAPIALTQWPRGSIPLLGLLGIFLLPSAVTSISSGFPPSSSMA